MDEIIDVDTIKLELESVAKSDTFARSQRMQQLLRYLVETDLSGNSDRLRSFNIAIDVFGRSAEFDPNNDSIVRVEAARLRRLLGAHYAANPHTLLQISIPKGRYLPAYEKNRDAQAQSAGDPSPSPQSPLHRPIGGPAIAVLPFTAGPNDERLRDGLTAELRFQLGRFAEFRVVDATSLSETPAPKLLASVASNLECQYLVQGRIAKANEGKRVHVEAIDVTNAHVLWSERMSISEQDTSLFDIEEEVATAIARALAPAPGSLIISGFERGDRPPRDWDAIDCVLRWHYYRVHSRNQASFDTLMIALKNLLEKHPSFSFGWAMLGYMTIDAWIYRMVANASFEAHERDARTYAERALSLAAKNSPARYVLGLCDYFNGDYKGFRTHFFAALEFNPNSLDLLHHGGTLLAFSGDGDGNWNQGRDAVLDADLGYSNTMGLRFFYVVDALREGDLDKASDLLSVVKPHGNWYWGHLLRAVIAEQQNNLTEAQMGLDLAIEDCPELEHNLQQEVSKWFGDKKMRDLLQRSLARLQAAR